MSELELKIGSTVRHDAHELPFIVYMIQTSDIQTYVTTNERLVNINAVSVTGTYENPTIVCFIGDIRQIQVIEEPSEESLDLLKDFKQYVEQGGTVIVVSDEDTEEDEPAEDRLEYAEGLHECLHGLIEVCRSYLVQSDMGLRTSQILRNIADRFDLDDADGPTSIN